MDYIITGNTEEKGSIGISMKKCMNNKFKKIVASAVTFILLFSTVVSANVSGEEVNALNNSGYEEVKLELENCVEDFESFINVNPEDNTIEYSSEKLGEELENINLDALNNYYKMIGKEEVTHNELVDMFHNGIEQLSDKLDEGELDILENGTIVESDDDSFYLQGGSTYDKTYWWGRRRYKSTSAAKTWAYKLNQAAAANAGAAVIAAAAFGGVGGVPNGLCSAYCWALSNTVSYVNGKTKKGIKADIYWILVYSVKHQ